MKPQNRTARDRKVMKRKNRHHPVNGIAMKRLLIERATKEQRVDVSSSDRYEVQS